MFSTRHYVKSSPLFDMVPLELLNVKYEGFIWLLCNPLNQNGVL